MNKLFVYGIFLDERNRQYYGMSNPSYDTVADYATYGGEIVAAYHQPNAGLALTGLVVNIDPARWPELDRLEGGYTRREVTTLRGERVYMYEGKD
jgi:gamma-glutamylcyclotransferase (GGCT)/AIG2-like uncharacterized protein YtfP